MPPQPRRATAERSRGSRTPEQLPPARPLKDRVGHAGEVAALAYLKEQGFRILARDWRSRLGQIDIVAEDGDTLVIVEVKTRSGIGFGRPAEAVTRQKLARMRRLAQLWLAANGVGWVEIRFDVVAVLACPGAPLELEHFPGVF